MILIPGKQIEPSVLHDQIRAQVPTLLGLGWDGATLTINSNTGSDFSSADQSTITSIVQAHDFNAIIQKQQQDDATRKADFLQIKAAFSNWDTLTPNQQLALVKKALQIIIIEGR